MKGNVGGVNQNFEILRDKINIIPKFKSVNSNLDNQKNSVNGIVHTQNMVHGLNLYLDSQSICVVGFGFPTMGGPMLGDPNTLLFP